MIIADQSLFVKFSLILRQDKAGFCQKFYEKRKVIIPNITLSNFVG